MSTNAKIGIAVVALVALVFVVTLLSQLSKPSNIDDEGGGGVDQVKGGLTPSMMVMRYEPTSGRAELRGHQQYYETGEHTVSFWVKNPEPVPFTVSFVYTSCTACSLAEFAVVPPLGFDPEDGDPSPFGAVAGGVVGQSKGGEDEPPFGLNDVAYRARKKIEDAIPFDQWQRLKPPGSEREVANVLPAVEVPAATADKPVWAIIRLNIKVTAAKELQTAFNCQRPDSPVALQLKLIAVVAPVEPCDVYPPTIDFKTIPADENTREATVYYWSHTRTVGGSADGLLAPLPPPDVTPRVRHITFSPPVPATPDELAALAARMAPPGDKDKPGPPPVRVAGAYKTTLRFSRLATEEGKAVEADLGPFDRNVPLPPDGRGFTLTKTPTVAVKATLLGAVRLAEGKSVKDNKIDLGSFSARTELVREVGLVSDKPGIELEAAPELTEPRYLKLDPELKPTRDGDRTRWTMTLRMGKDVGGGEIRPGSAVVLRVKGTGQLIRIPVTGRGN